MIDKLLVCVSLCIFFIGTYFIWFNKKNIFNHMNLGLCFVAYVIPPFVIDFSLYAKPEIWNLYVVINAIGALFFLLGMFIGYKWKTLRLVNTVIKFKFLASLSTDDYKIKKIIKVCNLFFISAIVGIIVSYAVMGFIPMFAPDPFLAKFFKGQYQVPYQRVAFLYRTSRQIIEFLMPLKILEILVKRDLKNIILVFVAIVLIAVSLNRGPIASGALIGVGIAVSLKKRDVPFMGFLFFVFLTYGLGSGMYYIILQLFPANNGIGDLGTGNNILEAIAYGAPDVIDQLNFLSAYVSSGSHLTYGLTFIGGLIPFNFSWNPAIYTLSILNDNTDVSGIASGGLRLPISLWGYVSFGWIGVVLLPFLSAFFTGYLTRKMKIILNNLSDNKNGYVTFFMVYFMFTNIAVIFTGFYILLIYSLPAFFIYYAIVNLKKSKVVVVEI